VAKTPPPKKTTVNQTAPAKGKGASGRPAGLFTWIAVGLVVVVVAGLVIIKVAGGTTSSGNTSFQAADPAVVAQLTSVPASVFDTVGVTSAVAAVSAPQVLKGQPTLMGKSSTGTLLPEVFYVGAEYCPFCAAERWPMIIALSRFGKWKGLGNMESSTLSVEVFPATPTFTFLKATYTSKYLVFKAAELNTNIFDTAKNNYQPLQKLTAQQNALFRKYDTPKYVKGMQPNNAGAIPFITYANKFIISGSSFTPAVLASQTRGQIAAGLSDSTSPVTDTIIASANYQTAVLCSFTKNQPGNVCNTLGVKAAKKLLALH
jgi:thiol-disulfide isomerase/thioredoxin